jgi:hypothetical protein
VTSGDGSPVNDLSPQPETFGSGAAQPSLLGHAWARDQGETTYGDRCNTVVSRSSCSALFGRAAGAGAAGQPRDVFVAMPGRTRRSRLLVLLLLQEHRQPPTVGKTANLVTKDLDPGASPEKWEKNINQAVETMFKHYP